VDLPERADQRFTQAARARDAPFTGSGSLRGVKRVAGHGVREVGQRAAIVDFRLCSLSLEVVQNSSELGDLGLVQIKLVGQETKRSSDSQSGPTLGPIPVVMVVMVWQETPSHLTTVVMSVVLMRLVMFWLA